MRVPHHEEDDDGGYEHPRSTGAVVADAIVQVVISTGKLCADDMCACVRL